MKVTATINGITYEASYADTKYFNGLAWLVRTNKGGKRLYPGTYPPEYAIRHFAEGNKPMIKTGVERS